MNHDPSRSPRTIYRSERGSRARRRRRRMLTAAAIALFLMVIAAVAAAVLLHDGESQAGSQPASQASPAPAVTPRALALGSVEVHAGEKARVAYRVEAPLGTTWTVTLVVSSSGGEQLLGKGDALFLAPGTSRPRRIHAPFLTEDETLRLVDWLKERGKPDYNTALLNAMETDEESASGGEEGGASTGDDIYDRALAVVKRERKASTSLLQRKLNIGYGRAARLIDRMEEEGFIGPDRGASKPREVLVGEDG